MLASLFSVLSRLYIQHPILENPLPLNADVDSESDVIRVSSSFDKMIAIGGAGSWPPRASHGEAWPIALHPYHHIYKEISPSLSVPDVVVDDEVNLKKITAFRTRMRAALAQIDMAAVYAILDDSDGDNLQCSLSQNCWNGFFACIAFLRHAYRWGVIPVVKIAQDEKLIDFPLQIDNKLWSYFQRRFGFKSLAGCNTAFFLYNWIDDDQLVYEINPALSLDHQMTEYNFSLVFRELEALALPLYRLFVSCIVSINEGVRDDCLDDLRSINAILPALTKLFTNTLTDSKVSRNLWMPYVQGFFAFGAGEIVDGQYVEFEGLSGNQATFILIIDAFLGMKPYLSEEDELRNVPECQRNFVASLRKFSFPSKVQQIGDTDMLAELDKAMAQMRSFRKAHLARVRPYLSQPLPERKIMTAGKGVLESEALPDLSTILNYLSGILGNRLHESFIVYR